jgi:hypothetical protein
MALLLLKEGFTVAGAFVWGLLIFVLGTIFGYILKKHEPKRGGE